MGIKRHFSFLVPSKAQVGLFLKPINSQLSTIAISHMRYQKVEASTESDSNELCEERKKKKWQMRYGKVEASIESELEKLYEEKAGYDDLAQLKKKRHRLFLFWCSSHFVHGIVYSIRYSYQFLYFKDVMKVDNPDFLYGVSVSLIGVTGVIFPLLISPYID